MDEEIIEETLLDEEEEELDEVVEADEAEADEADVDALLEEQRSIVAELEARREAETKREEIRAAVAAGAGNIIEKPIEEEHTVTNSEIRNTKEYVEAFARYLRTENDKECRALLTENVSGNLPFSYR